MSRFGDPPFEHFENEPEWPAPAPKPDAEPVDHHLGPIDRDEDRRWLDDDDPRLRTDGLDLDDEIGYEGER